MTNVSDLVKALQAATLSSSGMDIAILCSDHDTKDTIFNGLEALAAQQDAWQPIETAPKDGREIMIGSRNYSGEGFCALVKWDEKEGEWMLFDPSDDAWSAPTYGPLYWRPLPTVPGSENWTRNKDAIGLRQALDASDEQSRG